MVQLKFKIAEGRVWGVGDRGSGDVRTNMRTQTLRFDAESIRVYSSGIRTTRRVILGYSRSDGLTAILCNFHDIQARQIVIMTVLALLCSALLSLSISLSRCLNSLSLATPPRYTQLHRSLIRSETLLQIILHHLFSFTLRTAPQPLK